MGASSGTEAMDCVEMTSRRTNPAEASYLAASAVGVAVKSPVTP